MSRGDETLKYLLKNVISYFNVCDYKMNTNNFWSIGPEVDVIIKEYIDDHKIYLLLK